MAHVKSVRRVYQKDGTEMTANKMLEELSRRGVVLSISYSPPAGWTWMHSNEFSVSGFPSFELCVIDLYEYAMRPR